MKKGTNNQTEKVLTLVLFLVLAICMVLVLLTGTKVYKRLTERGKDSYENRTVPLYIATKVRQADCDGGVTTELSKGISVLRLNETIDGVAYITRIYCYDGYVRELFTAEETSFYPEAGERILPAEEVTFTVEGGCLKVTVKQANEITSEQLLTLRSVGREAGNEE